MNPYGINRISPSGLMLYEKCPRAFYYSVYLGLKLPQSMRHLEFGTAVHEAIDKIYEGYKDGKWNNSGLSNALVAFNQRFTPFCVNDEDRKKNPEVYKEMLDDGIEIIKDYWKNKEVLLAKGVDPLQFEIPGKEVMLHPETKEPWPLPLSYRLDGIGKNHSVIEFKTSGALYDNFEARARHQSLCYVLAYYQKFGVIPSLHYVVMLKGRAKNRIQHLDFKYDMADLLSYDSRVRALLDKIKNKEFSRPYKGHDKWCDCTKYEKELNVK